MNRCIEIIIAVLVLLSMFTGCYLKMPGTVNPEIRQGRHIGSRVRTAEDGSGIFTYVTLADR